MAYIVCSLDVQSCLLASVRWHLKRLSAARAWRRAARQSASNHGVIGLALRRTSIVGQWIYRAVLVEQFRHDDPVELDQIIDVLVIECGEIKA